MSELPSGWAETSLGEIVTLRAEKADPATVPDQPFIGLDGIEPHTSEIINVGKAADVRSAVACFEAGDVLYSRLRPYLNKVTIPDFNGVASAEIYALQPTGATDAEFVRRRIMTEEFLEFAALLDKGDRPRVSFKDISTFPISLPPKAEQRRIVEKVDSLTSRTARARKELDRIPTLIARYKQRLLALAFSGELTAGWRDAEALDGGVEVELGDVAQSFKYGSAAKSAPEGDVPVLRMGNIQDGKLDWSDLVYTSDGDEIAKFRLEPGDVLFNRTNSPELVGKTALYQGEREAVYAGYLIKIQCGPKLLPAFLTFCLNSPQGRAWAWQVKTDGVSQSNINAKKLAAFRFWLPSTLEQAEIIRRIESAFSWLDRLASEHGSAAKLLPKLDGAILAKAFRGELVPQEPNDEPASAMLERISEDRASYKSVKTSSKSNRKTRTQTSRKAKLTMTKSRHDEGVWQKPYLTGLLKQSKGATSPEELFSLSDLQLVDFYHQLSTEYENGWLAEVDGQVKVA